jgi:NAD(P)-dependent dehydrogenase (short-subunit alcohol dehydrogenase family)
MRVDLNDQVALVTGGAQGIGQAIAKTLAANGARVAIVDLEEAIVTAVAIEKAGGTSAMWRGDVTDPQRMDEIVAETLARWGRLDILVNNAGINVGDDRVPIHQFSADTWDRIVEVDLKGVFICSKAAIPAQLQVGGGRIINIASIAGLVPLRLQSAYDAAKAGVINLSKAMAIELGPQGILVNAVAPGSILTRGTEKLFYGPNGAYSEKIQNLLSHIPLGRPGRTDEIAHAVLFLAAPESSYITGTVLAVDGGWSSGYARDF